MKHFLLTLAALLCLLPAAADEGMWLPSLISERIDEMRAKGFRLTAEDIYSINRASMKDAVVLFDGGCTGELVSAEGLLLTNHHCAPTVSGPARARRSSPTRGSTSAFWCAWRRLPTAWPPVRRPRS